MFDGGFDAQDLAADLPLFDVLSSLALCENKWAFEKVNVAAELWEFWFERDTAAGGDVIADCGNNALAEIALRLGCSTTMAQNYAMLGIDLRLRLPLVRAEFAAGRLDYARAQKISRFTTGLTDKTVELAEPDIVAAARSLSPGPLGSAIDEVLIRIAPDEVAQRRIEATQFRKITKRRDGDLSVIDAALAPAEAEAAWQRVAEVAATVCRHDRRNRQYRLVDAFLALLHGEDRLQCRCGRDDCTATAPPPRRRAPLIQVSIDVATLLGLVSTPAHLEGYGPIDPELARELAKDGTWQSMLSESVDAAVELGLVDTTASSNGAVLSNGTVELHRRGRRHRAGHVPEQSAEPAQSATRSPEDITALVATALIQNPADGREPDGHGGHDRPPPGALDYRPNADITAIVRARDRHCRFPGCKRSARQCQIDHVVPFDHHAPHTGGWTLASNLQCLCAFHHQLKTTRLWSATILPGGIVVWISSYGTSHVTLPATLTTPADPDVFPIVRRGPEQWQPPTIDEGEPPF